jgi:D-alanyl-D-alanine dipeptidase
MRKISLVTLLLVSACATAAEPAKTMPADFTALAEVDPTIQQEIRYFGTHNFLGRRVKGYEAAKCILTRKAAQALKEAQDELKAYALSLRVYDCYRPQAAVDDFVAWAKDLSDTKMKKEFYPHVDKTNLFKDGYIAEKSGHSRGSTMDLTLDGVDMGTYFDYFDPLAHTANPAVTAAQRHNRLLLKAVMEKHGFKNLPDEWWHYTLAPEPYPDTYFAFEVR